MTTTPAMHPRWDPVVVERLARACLAIDDPGKDWDELDHGEQVDFRRFAGATLDVLADMGALAGPSVSGQPTREDATQ